MLDPKECPLCKTPAAKSCQHLALAVEARDFVRRCVELSNGQLHWQTLCHQHRARERHAGDWSPEQGDFMWLETAFRDRFLRSLAWFGGLDHEWRTGPGAQQGGFWVLLWSKNPKRLWWELHDELERQCAPKVAPAPRPAW